MQLVLSMGSHISASDLIGSAALVVDMQVPRQPLSHIGDTPIASRIAITQDSEVQT